MQVSEEKLDDSINCKLNISIPPDWIDPQVEQKLQEYAKQAKLPGFRPGKIPFGVIRQRFGLAVSKDVILEKLPDWIIDAIDAKKLVVAGITSINFPDYKFGNVCEFSVHVELLPDIPSSAYENLSFNFYEVEVNEQDIQDALRKIAIQNAEYVETDVSSGCDQRITLQYRHAEQTDEYFTPENLYYSGSNPIMKEFDNKLKGARAGDRIEVEINPNTFMKMNIDTSISDHNPEDKSTEPFLIQINKIENCKEQPQINDALAEKLGVEEGGLDELKKQVAKELERKMKKTNEMFNHLSIKDALYERNEKTQAISIPRSMYLRDASAIGPYPVISDSNLPNLGQDEIENRRKEILCGLIYQHIFTQHHGSEIEDSKLKEFLDEEAQSYAQPDKYIDLVLTNEQFSRQARMSFLQKFALEKIMETAEITKQASLEAQ